MRKLARTSCAAACGAWFWVSAVAQIPDQYPKPLIHTPTDHPAAHVLLLSVDGLHAVDLANWVAGHPKSALAELTKRGVTYTNAHTPAAYPVAGLVSLVTGGTPISTGIVVDDGYDRELGPPEPSCEQHGVTLRLDGTLDTIDANGATGLDSLKYPRDAEHGCTPVPPHALVRVNTMFEVVHTKIGPTAWIGESATATDLLRGPSGLGIDDSCSVEHVKRAEPGVKGAQDADEVRVTSVLHWIDAKDCSGGLEFQVPALFGMSFASVAVAQATPGMGYVDAAGTPSAGLTKSLAYVDEAIGKMIALLKKKELYDSTWIVVTAPYGQSPMDQRRVQRIALDQVLAAAESVKGVRVAHLSGGDAAMIWLSDAAKTNAVVKALGDQATALGIQDIYSGTRLALTLNSPAKDARMPDILLQPALGVLWGNTYSSALAGYGGLADEDTHVALLVSGAQLTGRTDPTWVPTTQVAPLLLRALGMEKFDLDALHREHTPALPGIF